MLQYAMLAGHMLLDDDPQSVLNENVIVRIDYIISQHLSFPEHVPRLARELLGRMIVGNPSLRADLFEVATHDWLKNHQELLSSIGRPPEPSAWEQEAERQLGIRWGSLPPPPEPNTEEGPRLLNL
jgi:hypothetical protein